jgi:polyribonucleotide nucleotidyltransferase
MIIGASADSVMMVEGEMDECSEEEMADAIKFAHEAIKDQINAQVKLADAFGRKEVREYDQEDENESLAKQIHDAAYEKCYVIAKKGTGKAERSLAFSELKDEIKSSFSEEELQENGQLISKYFGKAQKEAVRELVLSEGIRLDGRKTNEIRPIWCEVDYLPSTHGSSIFTRGETQALATVTLGTSREANQIDMPSYEGEERFYLHYNFPPFCTGEARPLRGTSRREVGHGNLAQRGLKGMIPEDCPYTVRVVSEVLESNGSSSMATVCSGTMALMDAGIKIKRPVSGIAMGLISDQETNKYAILSDILGDEDSLGDMDFKITGTKNGITACQMDIKILGISYSILEKSLTQASQGLVFILKKMNICLNKPLELKSHIPRFKNIQVYKDEIGIIIGPSGKTIQEIQKNTGVNINIEESEGIGLIKIFAPNKEGMLKAEKKILSIIEKPKIDKIYNGIVKSILSFGAFVEFMPGKDGLLHISEVQWPKVDDLSKVLKIGDKFKVKLISIDSKTGKYKLSKKILIPKD